MTKRPALRKLKLTSLARSFNLRGRVSAAGSRLVPVARSLEQTVTEYYPQGGPSGRP